MHGPAIYQRGLWPIRFVFLLIALACGITRAEAHRTSLAGVSIEVTGSGASVELELSTHDLAFALGVPAEVGKPVTQSFFDDYGAELERYVLSRVELNNSARACELVSYEPQPSADRDVVTLDLAYDCDGVPKRLEFRYLLFFEIDPEHRLLGHFQWLDWSEPFVLDRSINVATSQGPQADQGSWWKSFYTLVLIGAEHILAGADHLLFLLTLLMIPASGWQLAKTVTGFTIAHSITLALAWHGLIEFESELVEVAIALSIAIVAIENLFVRRGRNRWLEASAFGLVHGLGFYETLRTLRIEDADLLTRLLGFNLGVELGQLAIVLLALGPLLLWWKQPWYRVSARGLSVILIIVGVAWAIERIS